MVVHGEGTLEMEHYTTTILFAQMVYSTSVKCYVDWVWLRWLWVHGETQYTGHGGNGLGCDSCACGNIHVEGIRDRQLYEAATLDTRTVQRQLFTAVWVCDGCGEYGHPLKGNGADSNATA